VAARAQATAEQLRSKTWGLLKIDVSAGYTAALGRRQSAPTRHAPLGRRAHRFPSFEHAEHEVLHWIGFYNEGRLHEALGDLPPTKYEELNTRRDNSPMVAAT
jgi:transposase InsO family protein